MADHARSRRESRRQADQSNSAPRLRCKPGDRVIVIRSKRPQNVGKVGLVLRAIVDTDEPRFAFGPTRRAPPDGWLVLSQGSPFVVPSAGAARGASDHVDKEAWFYDQSLVPLSGDVEPESIDTREHDHA